MWTERLNILVVDDHPIVIEGLKKVLESRYPRLNLLCFTTAADTLVFVRSADPQVDLVLLDITLASASGLQLCAEIKTLRPHWRVVAFSNHDDRGTVMRMLQQGAIGYVLKNASSDEMLRCVEEALNGRMALSNQVQAIVARSGQVQHKEAPALTRREKEILGWIAAGKTSAEIADQLHLSPLTVETHRRNLMQKFGVRNSAALVHCAASFGFLRATD